MQTSRILKALSRAGTLGISYLSHEAGTGITAGPPAIYECTVTHTRLLPIRARLTHETYQWFVDLDKLPRLPWPFGGLGRFKSKDHLGDPLQSIRENVDIFLANNGIDLHRGRITMLTNARFLGYVFNPITFYWCHDANGQLACIVAEVHNTYRQRHCYLLYPDSHTRAVATKSFFVSPFMPNSGSYKIRAPEPGSCFFHSITLNVSSGPALIATSRGRRRTLTCDNLLLMVSRYPFVTLRVIFAIRYSGLKLWARGELMNRRSVSDLARWKICRSRTRRSTAGSARS
jgi:uncharacterized protein